MTLFQKKVYDVVKKIPKGQVLTYGQVANLLGNPKAARAVGNALHKNYDPAVPCHRVVKGDGNVGEYNRGKTRKRALLVEEGAL